jgi:hypothetical protein
MQDTKNGRVVMCKISENGLRQLSGANTACMEVMFELVAQQAEELASVKYDMGQRSRDVTQRDVCSRQPAKRQSVQRRLTPTPHPAHDGKALKRLHA